MYKKLYFYLIVLACMNSTGTSFAYNRATEKDDIILISTEKEKAIGANVARQVDEQFDETDDPLLAQKITAMGEKLAAVCDRQDLTYRFKVLKGTNEQTDFNAFALPGGFIYIFDYLAKGQKTDDAVAAILAHELAHVAAKHSIQRLQTGLGMNALMLLGLGLTRDGRTMAEAGTALGQLMLSYSREAEIEADKISVKYLKNAGYDANGIVQSLEFMRSFRKKGPVFPYIFNKTHPYLSERMAHAKVAVNGKSDFTSYINLPRPDQEYY